MQYEVLHLRRRRAHMVCFILRFWAGHCDCIWSVTIFILLQGIQFKTGNDLILSCPYVKYFVDFNTKRGICSAFAVLNL